LRALFCCTCCCADTAANDEHYRLPQTNVHIEDFFFCETNEMAKRRREMHVESNRKGEEQITYRKQKLVEQIKDKWDRFYSQYGVYRPVLDFMVV